MRQYNTQTNWNLPEHAFHLMFGIFCGNQHPVQRVKVLKLRLIFDFCKRTLFVIIFQLQPIESIRRNKQKRTARCFHLLQNLAIKSNVRRHLECPRVRIEFIGSKGSDYLFLALHLQFPIISSPVIRFYTRYFRNWRWRAKERSSISFWGITPLHFLIFLKLTFFFNLMLCFCSHRNQFTVLTNCKTKLRHPLAAFNSIGDGVCFAYGFEWQRLHSIPIPANTQDGMDTNKSIQWLLIES